MDPQREAAVWKRVFAAMEEPDCVQSDGAIKQQPDCLSVCRRHGSRTSVLPAAVLLYLCCRCGGCRRKAKGL